MLWLGGPAWLTYGCLNLFSAFGPTWTVWTVCDTCCSLCLGIHYLGQCWLSWAKTVSVRAPAAKQKRGAVLVLCPGPVVFLGYLSHEGKPLFLSRQHDSSLQTEAHCKEMRVNGRMQARLSTVLQQPHLPCFFPEGCLNRALTFPRNYLFNRWIRHDKITLPWDVEVSGVRIHTFFEIRRGSITQRITAASAGYCVVPVQSLWACSWWPGMKVTAWLPYEEGSLVRSRKKKIELAEK